MIEKQVVSIPFAGGIDTKTDDKLVIPGKLIDLQNGVFTKGSSIIKRNGYVKLTQNIIGGGTLSSNPQAVCVYDDELLSFYNNTLYSFSSTSNSWVNKGTIYSVKTELDQVIRNNSSQSRQTYAYCNGVEAFAYIEGTSAKITVIDSVSNTVYQSNTLLKAGCDVVKLVTDYLSSNYIYIFYQETATGKIFFRLLTVSSPSSIGNEVDTGKVASATSSFDVCESIVGSAILCVQTSLTNIYVCLVGTSGLPAVSPAPKNITVSADIYLPPQVHSNLYNNGNIWISWAQKTNPGNVMNLNYLVIDYSFSTVLASTTITNYGTFGAGATLPQAYTVASKDDSNAYIYIECLGSAVLGYGSFVEVWSIDSSGVCSKLLKQLKVQLASKAFYYANNQLSYVAISCSNVTATTQLQNTLFIMDQNGKFLSRNIYGQSLTEKGYLSNASFVLSGKYGFAFLEVNKIISDNGSTFSQAGVIRFYINFSHPDQFNFRQLGKNLHIAGGYLSIYDGVSCVESGFWVFPEYIQTVSGVVGAGGIDDGTYLVYAVYEWTDNKGQRHQSAPSIGSSITLSGGAGLNSIVVTIPTLTITNKKSPRNNVVISVYRTVKGGTIPYRVSSLTSPLYNDPTVTEVTFTTSNPDSSITTGEILYTTGGIIENISPPSGNVIEVYKNRIVIVPSEDKNSFWFSKTHLSGEGVAFSDSFYQKCDPMGGAITALKFLDDKLIIFKESVIFATNGDGPNDLGQQGSIAIPQLITSDCGCVYPNSIVYMPLGIMFKSNKGIYLLDRSLVVNYIGAEVEGYNSQDVTSAELIFDKNQVRFLTSSGYTLVYDYYYKQWSTFSNHTGIDADIYDGVYYYMRNDGKIYKESAGYYQDDNIEIRLSMTTAWIKMASIQGFQRARRFEMLGKYFSSHQLQMKIYYDYDDTTYNSVNFTPTTGVYQFRVHNPKQKCEAIKISLTDVASGTPGQGYSIADLSMEVGVKKGMYKLSAAKSTG